MGQNGSKWVKMDQNGSKWVKMGHNESKWVKMSQNGSKWIKMDRNGSKWVEMDQNGSKWVDKIYLILIKIDKKFPITSASLILLILHNLSMPSSYVSHSLN